MKRAILLAVLLALSNIANAAIWTDGTQMVQNIIWKPGYHGFYATAATFQDPEGCPGSSSRLYLFDNSLDEKTVDRLYAMLLMAMATGKTVYVWVDGCTQTGPKVTGLQINN